MKEIKKEITKEGYEKLQKELAYREGEVRSNLSQILNEMRNQGDLSENDGYSMAVEQNEQNEEEIARIKEVLATAKIVKSVSKNKVGLGNTVVIVSEDKKESTYTIVGEEGADPLNGLISYNSPIGSALMDRKVGENVKLSTPRGEISYTVKSVN
jgi:transcription elongation factor GreA